MAVDLLPLVSVVKALLPIATFLSASVKASPAKAPIRVF